MPHDGDRQPVKCPSNLQSDRGIRRLDSEKSLFGSQAKFSLDKVWKPEFSIEFQINAKSIKTLHKNFCTVWYALVSDGGGIKFFTVCRLHYTFLQSVFYVGYRTTGLPGFISMVQSHYERLLLSITLIVNAWNGNGNAEFWINRKLPVCV